MEGLSCDITIVVSRFGKAFFLGGGGGAVLGGAGAPNIVNFLL